jgi:hypothetical protein
MPEEYLDVERLIAEIAKRHGVLLNRGDAAFALVTMNELVLERYMHEIEAKVRDASGLIETSAVHLQSRAGALIGRELRKALDEFRATLRERSHSNVASAHWNRINIAAATLANFAAGVLFGSFLQ